MCGKSYPSARANGQLRGVQVTNVLEFGSLTLSGFAYRAFVTSLAGAELFSDGFSDRREC